MTLTLNLTSFSTTNVSIVLNVFQVEEPGNMMINSPDVTVMYSVVAVPNSYSPGAITPMVAGPSGVLNAIDFTFPSKYSLVLNIYN